MNRIGQQREPDQRRRRVSGINIHFLGKVDERQREDEQAASSWGGRERKREWAVNARFSFQLHLKDTFKKLHLGVIISLDRRQAAVDGPGRTGERLEGALRAPAPLASLSHRNEGVGEAPVD